MSKLKIIPTLLKNDRPWCVDGRGQEKGSKWQKGPQMLGGSLHPIVVAAISSDMPFNRDFIEEKKRELVKKGFPIAVHTDTHSDCGCGFCAHLGAIFNKFKDKKGISELLNRLSRVYRDNKQAFDTFLKSLNIPVETFQEILEESINKIAGYHHDFIQGAELLTAMQEGEDKALCLVLDGDHNEEEVYVNLRYNMTNDTDNTAKTHPLFNMDLWAAAEECMALGVNPGESVAFSLLLYEATEMVLVEDNGNSPLPIFVHS